MSPGQNLRNKLAEGIVQAPGAPDSLSTRMIEQARFPAVYMTGLGATAIRLGAPDIELLTQTEMADHARNMVRATSLPVIADADNGYGGVSNIERSVQEYEQAGVAALHLEDQASPKRCGQMSGARLLPRDESALRIRAASKARQDNDFVIIGRTDALGVEGIEEAIRRANEYLDHGADLAFIDGVKTLAEVEGIANRLEGPKVISIVAGTEPESLTLSDIQELGFSLVLYPLDVLFGYLNAASQVLQHLKAEGASAGSPLPSSYQTFSQVVGLEHHQDLENQFLP